MTRRDRAPVARRRPGESPERMAWLVDGEDPVLVDEEVGKLVDVACRR